MNPIIEERLQPLARRWRWRQLGWQLALGWLILGTAGFLVTWSLTASGNLNRNETPAKPVSNWVLGWGTIVGVWTGVVVWQAFRTRVPVAEVVRDLERRYPDLDSGLMTAWEQRPATSGGQLYNYFQQEIIRNALYHDYRNHWIGTVPRWQVGVAWASCLGSLVGFLSMAWFTSQLQPTPDSVATPVAQSLVVSAPGAWTVEPGSVEVERGTSLLVLTRFAQAVPPETWLWIQRGEETPQRIAMLQSLSDPLCSARIELIQADLSYWVEFGSEKSPVFRVTTFQVPDVKRVDVALEYPAYTGLSPALTKNVRQLRVVAGTRGTFDLTLNAPGLIAELVDSAERVVPCAELGAGLYRSPPIEFQDTTRFEVRLRDAAGRPNRSRVAIQVVVQPNGVPQIKWLNPGRDVSASPLEEILLKFEAWDDFGINRAGVTIEIAGQEPVVLELTGTGEPAKRGTFEHLLALEDYGVAPDDLVTYHAWVEDRNQDEVTRSTASDIYFVEVRPFEEIFRQAADEPENADERNSANNSPSGNENSGAAENLAELQKQIIAATWNLSRRIESTESQDDTYATDLRLILDSQNQVNEGLGALRERVNSASSLAIVGELQGEIQSVVDQLTQAAENPQSLTKALTGEQRIYRGLLRLRAREIQVARQNRSRSSSSSSRSDNARQSQMQQLQLQNERNPYEQETQAQTEEPEARENRQVLNRLKELAQRQQDLTQQIQELENQLQQPANDSEAAERSRQLQRLREEQEQLLRDADELLDRMQAPENQQEMAEAAQQLQQARENLQQSAEQLQQTQLSQAAAQGTRAAEQLNELKEDFQRRTAGQFSNELSELENQTRELAERQRQLQNQLDQAAGGSSANSNSNSASSLRDSANQAAELRQSLSEQQRQLDRTQEEIRKLVEAAEGTEPLLAERLYDSFRDLEQSPTRESLESAERSAQRGLLSDAARENQAATAGIEQLQERIAAAAQDILGDESAALQRANEEIERLTREVAEELSREAPELTDSSANPQTRREQSPDGSAPEASADDRPGRQAAAPTDNIENRDVAEEELNRRNERSSASTSEPAQSQENPQDDQRSRPGTMAEQRNGDENTGGANSENPLPDRDSRAGQGEGDSRELREATSENEASNSGDQPRNADSTSPNRPRRNRSLMDDDEPPTTPPTRDPPPARNFDQTNTESDSEGAPPRNAAENSPRRAANGSATPAAPLSGGDFRQWVDRLRDVEEMLRDPDLQAETAEIRNRAREIRRDMQRRGSPQPQWDLVNLQVLQPLQQLQREVRNEILKKANARVPVPLDRDPVPPQFTRQVEEYFRELGAGK